VLRVLVFLAFVAAAASEQPRRQVPADFAVRLEFGCANVDVLDTAKGTYERSMSREPKQIANVEVTQQLRERWFDLATETRFFAITSDRLAGLGICEPSMRYEMTVSGGGKHHTVRWEDCWLEPTIDEHKRIMTLAGEILKDVNGMPAVKRLRPTDLICL
jgi:hypothetical protein